jgi:hypothetical protein
MDNWPYIVIVLNLVGSIDDLVGPFNTFYEAESWTLRCENLQFHCEIFRLSAPVQAAVPSLPLALKN